MGSLIDTFGSQPLDFFGALRCAPTPPAASARFLRTLILTRLRCCCWCLRCGAASTCWVSCTRLHSDVTCGAACQHAEAQTCMLPWACSAAASTPLTKRQLCTASEHRQQAFQPADSLTQQHSSVILCVTCRRASLYDQQILDWIKRDILKGELVDEDADMAELSRRLVNM